MRPRPCWPPASRSPGGALTAREAVELFEDQVRRARSTSRRASSRRTNRSFYTISSAGHEDNAVVGALLRLDDPCFLHYRSGAFMMARCAQAAAAATPSFDTLLSLCASAEDPISRRPPQGLGQPARCGSRRRPARSRRTCPRRSGLAFALGARAAARASAIAASPARRDRRVLASATRRPTTRPRSRASTRRATPPRAAARADPVRLRGQRHRHLGRDAARLDRATLRRRSRTCATSRADGRDRRGLGRGRARRSTHCRERARAGVPAPATRAALGPRRQRRRDRATARSRRSRPIEARDPLLRNARRLLETGRRDAGRRCARSSRDTRARVTRRGDEAARRPQARDAPRRSIAPLAPYDEARCARAADRCAVDAASAARCSATGCPRTRRRRRAHAGRAHQRGAARRAAAPSRGARLRRGRRAGRAASTTSRTGLQKRFGVGARLRHAARRDDDPRASRRARRTSGSCRCRRSSTWPTSTTRSTSCAARRARSRSSRAGQFTNPMVVRIAGLAYQKGFGGHFHNDNCDRRAARHPRPGARRAGARRRRGADAARRRRDGARVRPRRRLPRADRALPREGPARGRRRRGGSSTTRRRGERAAARRGRRVRRRTRRDLLIVTYANGVRLSLRAARTARAEHGIARARARPALAQPAAARGDPRSTPTACGRVLVVDECRATGGGIADAIVARPRRATGSAALRSCARPTRTCRSARPPPPCSSAWTRSWPPPSAAAARTKRRSRPPPRHAA